MAARKPVEEFYDLQNDPHEIKNLANDPAYRKELARFRKAHQKWSTETRDLGLIPEPEMVLREEKAGSRYDILASTDDKTLPERLGRMAAMASEGADALPQLLKGLDDQDAAVRYWAATGIGNIAGRNEESVLHCLDRIQNDSSTVVRIAAARALLRIGYLEEKALEELTRALESPEEWCRLHAAIVLDEAGEKARPALPALKKALKNQPNKYIIRVANKAVNDLLGTKATVK
jgi:uncharacterized sulfatase